MAGKTILVVDGNDTSRIYLFTTLRKKGFTTFEASSGRQALIFAWRDPPDLVLFDPAVIDLQVKEFIQKLRRHATKSMVKLVHSLRARQNA